MASLCNFFLRGSGLTYREPRIIVAMTKSVFKLATHLSIAWGVTLAVLTMLEWRSLDREPMREQIITPFIQRDISVKLEQPAPADEFDFGSRGQREQDPDAALQYTVEFHFNGPLFLAIFFIPVLAFHGLEWLVLRVRQGAS